VLETLTRDDVGEVRRVSRAASDNLDTGIEDGDDRVSVKLRRDHSWSAIIHVAREREEKNEINESDHSYKIMSREFFATTTGCLPFIEPVSMVKRITFEMKT
jgi:hypothetical protein